MAGRPLTLSPSALSEFRESPRGFWLEKKHGCKRPRGIFSAMPNAIDALIKERYDAYRGRSQGGTYTLPPELARLGNLGASLFNDPAKLKKMRFWSSAPLFVDDKTGARLSGALDDALVIPSALDGAKELCSLDVKTTKSRDNLGEYSAQYYLLGQSCYHLMLDAELTRGGFAGHQPNIERVGSSAVLAYYMPERVETPWGAEVMRWRTDVVQMPVDREFALEVLRAAVECLNGPLPEPGRNEDWDGYVEQYSALVKLETPEQAAA